MTERETKMTDSRSKFNPSQHLMDLKGKPYLPVRNRIQWLRSEHPDATIITEAITIDLEQGFALFKATVTIPGGGIATGYGSETSKDFKDYIEKGETKSVGRALGALGYGTEFSLEWDEGIEPSGGLNVVDAPASRTVRHEPKSESRPEPKPEPKPNGDDTKVYEKYAKALREMATKAEIPDEDLVKLMAFTTQLDEEGKVKSETAKTKVEDLTMREGKILRMLITAKKAKWEGSALMAVLKQDTGRGKLRDVTGDEADKLRAKIDADLATK